jgi:hypothetical protein
MERLSRSLDRERASVGAIREPRFPLIERPQRALTKCTHGWR